MFLYQKLNRQIVSLEDFVKLCTPNNDVLLESFMTFDTETTGLNIITDKPFMGTAAWGNYACEFPINEDSMKLLYTVMRKFKYVFAHNMKFDYHMTHNAAFPIPDDINICDSVTVARLTTYVDDPNDSLSLETLGTKYVDKDAKFAGKVIKNHLNEINERRLKHVKKLLKQELKVKNITDIMRRYRKRVQFVKTDYDDIFDFIDANYAKPTYYDVYKEYPELMKAYAIDDTIIEYEYLKKALPVLEVTDPEFKVFNHECQLIRVVARMERTGLKTDVNYLLESRERLMTYIDMIYKEMWDFTGVTFTSGQHDVIKRIFEIKFGIAMSNCDMQALKNIKQFENQDAVKLAKYIIELRHLDKWLSTYIEGMLNRVLIADDGTYRIYTDINNTGAVTGRVSSNLQQQPKEALKDRDGNELFHPRRATVCDIGGKIFFYDYAQMEMRVQAHYTIKVMGGDMNLCRAFMPFKCTSFITGEEYDIKKHDWSSGEWVDENGDVWQEVDLHNVTARQAFPDVKLPDDDKYWKDHYRGLGKRCNFLKTYGGGIKALKDKLEVSDDIAQALNSGFYKGFPGIKDYQKDINDKAQTYGYVANVFGRRYYIMSMDKSYRLYNYVIQGGCADILKDKQIRIDALFREIGTTKSKLMLPIHDELMIFIHDDELYLVDMIKEIMDDCADYIDTIPMISEPEYTDTNWAEKKDYITNTITEFDDVDIDIYDIDLHI